MNRMANCHNKYQGGFKKVLCVCSAGLLRSPTIAWVLSNDPFNCNTRAAGIIEEYALVPVDEVLLEWADEVVCAEREHSDLVNDLMEKFAIAKPIHTLDVPDRFRFRDPKMITEIEYALRRIAFLDRLKI